MKRIAWTRAAVALCMVLVACGRPTSWSEEVQLRSGEVLKVRRTIQFKEYQPFGGGGGGADTPISELEIVSPTRPDNPGKWSHRSLLPMVLDRDSQTNEWFVVATFFMCNTWREIGRPDLPYVEFRYRNGNWVRVPIDRGLVGREANVLVPNQADVERDHTLTTKGPLMSRPEMALRFKRILSTWATNC